MLLQRSFICLFAHINQTLESNVEVEIEADARDRRVRLPLTTNILRFELGQPVYCIHMNWIGLDGIESKQIFI